MPKQPEGLAKRFHFSVARLEKLPIPTDRPAVFFDLDVPKLAIRVQPVSGTRTFFILKRTGGRTYRKTIGQFPELKIEQAREHAHRLLREVAKWKAEDYDGICPLTRPDDGELTFGVAFEQYLRSPRPRATNREKAEERSRALYDGYLTRLANRKVSQITPTETANLHQHISEEHGPVVANRCLELTRAIYNVLIKKSLVVSNPVKGVTMHRSVKRDRFLQPNELVQFEKAMAAEPNKDLVDFVTLLLSTGARKSNVYAMKWADVGFERETWTIGATDAKAGETITIPLTPRALDVLKARFRKRQNTSPWVFPSRASESGHIQDYKRQWHRLRKSAGISDVMMHSLRHTFASYMAISGASLKTIGTSLGHRSVNSTAIYAHLLGSAVRKSQLDGEETQRRLMAEAEKNQKVIPMNIVVNS